MLLSLARRTALPSGAAALATELAGSRTLTCSLGEVADAVELLVDEFPDLLRRTTRVDPFFERPAIELVQTEEAIQKTVAGYAALRAEIEGSAAAAGVELSGARVLEVGTGCGYLAVALAGAGAAQVVGIDITPEVYVTAAERERVHELLGGSRAGNARVEVGDVHVLDFPDGSFDIVCGVTAIEHFRHPQTAFGEMRRVLRPGGVIVQGVEPWFGPRGGHALCTLDFPWGHLRLTPEEFARYMREQRPYEADCSIAEYAGSFQQPRLTLAESRAAWSDAGFEIVEWRELPMRTVDPHRGALDDALLADVRRQHPTATRRDLSTLTYTLVARAV